MLHDKVVAITGAGRGLGRAYAISVAAAGAKVLLNDVVGASGVVEEIRRAGGAAAALDLEIGTPAAGEQLIDACVDTFGRIDGLINNAGLCHLKLSWEENPDDAERIIRVNLFGTIHCAVAAMKRMRLAGSGVIINIGSGAMLGMAEMSAYGCSKAAVLNLTVTWAKELEGTGVRVHAISPTARTPMNLASAPQYFLEHGPELVAPLAVFLLSDRAAPLNGKMIRLDRGRLSFFEPGNYGPVLGESLNWTNDALEAALMPGASIRP